MQCTWTQNLKNKNVMKPNYSNYNIFAEIYIPKKLLSSEKW